MIPQAAKRPFLCPRLIPRAVRHSGDSVQLRQSADQHWSDTLTEIARAKIGYQATIKARNRKKTAS